MKIVNYILLNSKGGYFNSRLENTMEASGLDDLYTKLGIDYPKFYKMDSLSQLGFLLAEGLTEDAMNKVGAILVWNKHSSFDADKKHTENVAAGISGPANFTYTLPNIVVGEIAIRHKINGETGIFITLSPDFKQIAQTTKAYLNSFSTGGVWIGWLDAREGILQGFMCYVVQDTANIDIFAADLENIYAKLIV